MEDVQILKSQIRKEVATRLAALSQKKILEKTKAIETKLFEFANFLESKISLLYINSNSEVSTRNIIVRSFAYNKVVVLPAFDTDTFEIKLMKVDDLKRDLKMGPRGILEPNPDHCKIVPIERVDIAIVPAVALDEKGARLGSG